MHRQAEGEEDVADSASERGSQTAREHRTLWTGIPVHTVTFSAREAPKSSLYGRRVRTEFEPPC